MRQPGEGAMRVAFFAAGVGAGTLAVGYATQQPWAVASWPWVDGRLGNIFVGSVLAAVAAPMLWIAWTGRLAAAAAGFIHLCMMFAGLASVLAGLAADPGREPLKGYATTLAVLAVCCLLLAVWAHRLPATDMRPLTRPMRAWFGVFLILLVYNGWRLHQQITGVMPWPVKAESSSLYSWVFLSAVCSFLYPLLRPRMEYASVGLIGFLVYDVVLLPPLLMHFDAVQPEFRLTLILYCTALALTAAVSLWYLLLCRATRIVGGSSTGGESACANP